MALTLLSHLHTCGFSILHTSLDFKSPKQNQESGNSLTATEPVPSFHPRRRNVWEHASVRFVLLRHEIAPRE